MLTVTAVTGLAARARPRPGQRAHDAIGPIDIAIADYAFEVGPNCTSCSLTPSFDALVDISVDGHAQQIDLPFAWRSTGPTDSLSFAAAAPVVFDLGAAGKLRFELDDIGTRAGSGGFVRGQLYATSRSRRFRSRRRRHGWEPAAASFRSSRAGAGAVASRGP